MHLIRRLVLACMHYNFLIRAPYISFKLNTLPDLLYRLHITALHMVVNPTEVSENLLQLLSTTRSLGYCPMPLPHLQGLHTTIPSVVLVVSHLTLSMTSSVSWLYLWASSIFAFCKLQGLAGSAIASTLSAIACMHKLADLPNPANTFLIQSLLNSLKTSAVPDNSKAMYNYNIENTISASHIQSLGLS